MSLSWKKRQALASDQKTWRGLGVDSALWTSIDRNASNVTSSLVRGSTNNVKTTGIVTGLKFVKTEGLDFTTPGEVKFYTSDASNSSIESQSGVNQFDTTHPVATSGNGLVFTMKKYDANSDFKETELNTDISGIKYYINSGGSGYNVGDDIMLQGSTRRGVKFTWSSTTTLENPVYLYEPVVQDPYRVTDISVNLAAPLAVDKGDIVQLFNGDLEAAGTLTGNLPVTSNLHDFSVTAAAGFLTGSAAPAVFNFFAPTAGTLTGSGFTGANFSPTAGTLTGSGFTGDDFSPTAGTLTGSGFAGHDFSGTGNDEDLIVVVDGGSPQTLNLTVLMTNINNAATAIDGLLTGASCTVSGSGSSAVLVITSSTTGTSSSVSISTTTDPNAVALFGSSPTATAGTVNAEDLIVVVDGGSAQTVTLNTDLTSISDAATAITGGISETCTVSGSGSSAVLVITSGTTGTSSSVSISTTTDTNALALFGSSPTATDGAANSNESLKIRIDGGAEETITLISNVTSTANAATTIDGLLTGASCAVSGSVLRITSATTGSSSSITMNTTGSGANAVALFGSPTSTAGVDSTAETLKITVDNGAEQPLSITANVTDIATAIGSGGVTGITGATVSNDSGKIKITSTTTGTSSKVSINTLGSGSNAVALFGNTAPGQNTFTTTIGNGDADIIATGFLSETPGGAGKQNITIHSSTNATGNFMNTEGKTMKINNVAANIGDNGAEIGTAVTPNGDKELKSTERQKTGFANGAFAATPGVTPELGQWVTRDVALTFRGGSDSAFSDLKSSVSGKTIIKAANMGGAPTINKTLYNNLANNAGAKAATGILNGRLTARVTSVVSTSAEKPN